MPKYGGRLSHGHLVYRAGLTGDASYFTNDSLDSSKTATRASDIESRSTSVSGADGEPFSTWKDDSGLIFCPDLYQQRSLFVGKMEPDEYRRESNFILQEKVKSPFASEERSRNDDTSMENELGKKLINSNAGHDHRGFYDVNELRDKEHFEDMTDEMLLP